MQREKKGIAQEKSPFQVEVRIHPNAKAKIPTASNNKENVEVGVYASDFHTEESVQEIDV